MSDKQRCDWPGDHALMIQYHDYEYGVLEENNNKIFERLMLEVYQAGLSWRLVLDKRAAFNNVFFDYNIDKVAKIRSSYIDTLMENKNIIRNRRKLEATVNNAKVIQSKIEELGSAINYFRTLPYQEEVNTGFKQCIKIMKRDGFKFIGKLVLEEFFMSVGLNAVKHQKKCFLF